MSAKLSHAYQEIKDWSDTLNVKVEEKTRELKNIYDKIVENEKLAFSLVNYPQRLLTS